MFQSSPGPRAGRCADPLRGGVDRHVRVSILARPEGRALPCVTPPSMATPPPFQSSPGPRAGRCHLLPWQDSQDSHCVSILARPEGRALRRSQCPVRCHAPRFNPRPARGPGAARTRHRRPTRAETVSILARPEGRALQLVGRVVVGDPLVSILARPEGRALRRRRRRAPSRAASFNPRPARGPGAAGAFPYSEAESIWFQSSPGPRAGRCLRQGGRVRDPDEVSILARPEGRALPCDDFQSRSHTTHLHDNSYPPSARDSRSSPRILAKKVESRPAQVPTLHE